MANVYVKKCPAHNDIQLNIEEFIDVSMLKDLHISYVEYIEVKCENEELFTFNRELLANLRKNKKDERLARLPKIDSITIFLNLLLAEKAYNEMYGGMTSIINP